MLLQAGLNLNIAGAVSGLFSGKSKKETNADGSSKEEREEKAAVSGTFIHGGPELIWRLIDIDRFWCWQLERGWQREC